MKELFSFTSRERNAILVLIVIILLLIIIRLIMPYVIKPDEVNMDAINQQIEDSLYAYSNKQPKKDTNQLFMFNPNLASETELLKLGLSPRQVKNIINFRKSGGSFFYPDDLKKIYTLTKDDYNRLIPYVGIDNRGKKEFKKKEEVPKSLVIELNSADTAQLKKLKGIGTVLSQRIIKYRNSLGGFYSIDQLTEVYGLNQEVISINIKSITIDTSLIQKIPLADSNYYTLVNHPYLSRYNVKSMLYYMQKNSEVNELDHFKKNNVLPDSIYTKIAPYLIFM